MVHSIQSGIIYNHVQIPRTLLGQPQNGLLKIGGKIPEKPFIFQPQPHVVPSGSAHHDPTHTDVPKGLEVHVPKPGNILSVQLRVIDLDHHILGPRILLQVGELLLKPHGVLGQMKLHLTAAYNKHALPAISVMIVLHSLPKSPDCIHGCKGGVSRQYIIDIIGEFYPKNSTCSAQGSGLLPL